MRRLFPDPELARALQAMMARAKADGTQFQTVKAIESDLSINCEKYRAPMGGLSSPLVYAAANGEDISTRTSEILRRFVNINAPDLLPPLIPKTDLDLGRFFGADSASMIQAGRAIEGTFQTYARSTSMPDYVRLGRMTFRFFQQQDNHRIAVEEEQFRPAIGTRGAWSIVWDGYAAPRGRSYFIVMRIEKDHYEDGTASLGIVKALNRANGLVQRATLYGLQHDFETGEYPHFRCILVRTNAKPITTFTPLIEFDNKEIIKDLCLEETVRDLKRKARRRRKP